MKNGKALFTARITFNNKTIQRVFKAEYFTYDKLKVIFRAAAGFALIAMAVFIKLHTALTVLLLLAGCWLIVALDFPSKVRAEGVIQSRGGAANTVNLKFFESSIEVVEERKSYDYTVVDRLTCDKDFLFIFYSRQNAIMIDSATLSPKDVSGFRNFIAGKTGKKWKTTSIFLMNLSDLKQALKDFKF